MMTEVEIILADMDAWQVFADVNRDALEEHYGSTAKACQHAIQGGLMLGGGAAPLVFIRFAEQIEPEIEQKECHHRDDGRGQCIDCGSFLPSSEGKHWE